MCEQVVPNFRVRTIPVLGTLPAAFGLAAASHVLCELAAAPFAPEPVFRLLEVQYATQLQRLTEREDLIFGNSEGPAVDLDDVREPLCSLHASDDNHFQCLALRTDKTWQTQSHCNCQLGPICGARMSYGSMLWFQELGPETFPMFCLQDR